MPLAYPHRQGQINNPYGPRPRFNPGYRRGPLSAYVLNPSCYGIPDFNPDDRDRMHTVIRRLDMPRYNVAFLTVEGNQYPMPPKRITTHWRANHKGKTSRRVLVEFTNF